MGREGGTREGKSRCRPPSSAPTRPCPTIGCSHPAACHPPGPRAALAGFGFGRRGTLGTRLGPAGQGWETRGTSPLPDLGPEGPTSV